MQNDIYEKTAEFQRNEAIWVLHTIDQVPVVQITELFNLDKSEVMQILQKHQQYQENMSV